MKIFHTADWHLGKLVKEVYMTEDQRYVLEQFLEAARNEHPDAIIIAGDLYDRSVPPNEAVSLLHDILTELVVKLEIPVLAIAGNHDSPERLQFGSSILEKQGLYISGKITGKFKPIILYDEHGPVHFHLVPYADPGQIRHLFQDVEIRTHDDAMRTILQEIKRNMDPDARHVLVGHAFVTPTGEQGEFSCDSEKPLSIGGADYISAHHFNDFHYVALGHLHQAHFVGTERIRYSGSPLKYSISEEKHRKGFNIVHIDIQGNLEIEKRSLEPLRDMRSVEARLEDLKQHERCEDYVFVSLLNEDVVLFPMEQVRAIYPNAMHVSRKESQYALNISYDPSIERKNMDSLTLFKSFFKETNGQDVPSEMEELFREVLEEALRGEKERI